MPKYDDKVVVIVGQTGVGKTDISLKIAGKYRGEIINCDASSMKKHLNIGTAKVDLSKTKIRHHLIDIIDPTERYSCADFQREARSIIKRMNHEGKLPFIVGGTGLYACAAIYDYNLTYDKMDIDLSQYDIYTNDELHDILEKEDYETSLKIHKNNRVRMIRAIDSARHGFKVSEKVGKHDLVYDALVICLTTDREVLYKRIDARVDKMIKDGFEQECRDLIKMGYELIPIFEIGYSQMWYKIAGMFPMEDVLDNIKQHTRRYAKRQMTWFKNQMDCVFVEMNYNYPNKTVDEICKLIDDYLNK